jgi:hypothetical protein
MNPTSNLRSFAAAMTAAASLEPSDPEDTPDAEPVQPQLHEPRPPVIRPDLNLED